MASHLITEGFLDDFQKLPNEPADYILPEQIDREHFSLFLRMMEAKTPDEIADISTDTILSMFDHIREYSSCIKENCIFRDTTMLKKLKKTVPTTLKKRPL